MIYIDCYSLYECLVNLGTTKEKSLMINIEAIHQAYERRDISQVIWIKAKSNPADSMTKSQPSNHALGELLANKYLVDKEAWLDRDGKENNQ